MKPRLIPNPSSSTLAVVARQLVVHDALEMIRCRVGSYVCSFTPGTIVASGSFAGAGMITFLAPARRCLEAVAVSRETPGGSATTSTPRAGRGAVAGALAAQT